MAANTNAEVKVKQPSNISISRSNCSCSERIIEIRAVSEKSFPPDLIKGQVTVNNTKKTTADVKESVCRRLDYIMQVLRRHAVKEDTTEVVKSLVRQKDMFSMTVNVFFTVPKLETYLDIANLLTEKLDSLITIYDPEYHHSFKKLENYRLQVCLTAIQNAKEKATEIARSLNQRLGKPISIIEEAFKEGNKLQLLSSMNSIEFDQKSNSFQNKMDMATISVHSQSTKDTGILYHDNACPMSSSRPMYPNMMYRSFPDNVTVNIPMKVCSSLKTKHSTGVSSSHSQRNSKRTIHQVARDGDVPTMKMLLEFQNGNVRQKINELNAECLSPLHYAARYNHFAMVKFLVDRGANVNIRGEDGLTPLHLAARYKKAKHPKLQRQKRHYEINDYSPSVKHSLKQYSSGYLSDSGISSSWKCPCESIVLYLVSQEAEVNSKDNYGLTPLHYAAMRGNEVATRDLLQCKGINIEARDTEDTTPLHLAAVHGNKEIASLLINAGANLRCLDENSATPLHRAAREGNFEIVKLLIEAAGERGGQADIMALLTDQDNEQNTALHLAVENSYCGIVKYLISKGANVNIARQNFVYPMHLAAVTGDEEIIEILLEHVEKIDCLNVNQETPLHRAAEFNRPSVLDHLILHGANMERREKDNFTPLLLASSHGHVEAIECLLQHGADINAVDKDDKTAIYWAAQQNKHDAVMALLRDPRSKVLLDRPDRYGNSPLHVAAKKGFLTITQTFLDQGAHIDLKNEEEQMPLHLASKFGRTKIVRELIRHNKQIINGEDEDGNTSLHLAALAGHEDVLKALLEVGANVEARNSHMWTPLDCAASKGWIHSVRVLLAANCPVDPLDRTKTTPLHLAASTGSVEVCMLLLEWGADISRRDDQGRNCLELAIENSQKDVAMAIIQSDYWLDALRCENINNQGVKKTPLRLLIKKMPEVAEEVCNRCTRSNFLPSDHPLYTVTFNYELLDDTYTQRRSEDSTNEKNSCSGRNRLYSQYGNIIKENHPLMIMVRSRRQKLLAHPLCISLIHLKWVNFGRCVYYSNLLMYLMFVTFLTGFLLSIPTPTEYVSDILPPPYPLPLMPLVELNSTSQDQMCPEIFRKGKRLEPSIFALFCKYIVIILSSFHLFREFFQMYMLRLYYLCLENLLEWACYVTALLLVIDFTECSDITGIREPWQWQAGAITIFLGWMNLILFIRKLPYLGIYVVMFTDVLTTFCKVCVVFFFFIIAFALAFHTVMYYEDPFSTAGKSIVRAMVMMLGEMEFDDFFMDNQLRYPKPTYFFFISFIVLICLITMNLLVGLAVDDIKTVQEQANLKRLAMQVELVLNVESVLPQFLQKRFFIAERSFMPNRNKSSFFEHLLSHFNTTQTVREALMAQEKTEIEKIQECQETMAEKMAVLSEETQKLQNRTEKLYSLVHALAQHHGMRWEDDDKCNGLDL